MSIVISGDSPNFTSATLTTPTLTSPTISNPTFTGTTSGSVITSGTAVASTSGTSIDFTSIPSWAKRVTVLLNNVSLSGTASILVQLGAGSVVTTGYVSASGGGQNAGSWSVDLSTAGFLIRLTNASRALTGSLSITLLGSNAWVANGTFGQVISTVGGVISGGSITLGGALDRLRITTDNGTDTFDTGTVNILYE